MEQVLLVRYGEIHLKGLNRPFFERKLVEGIMHALSDFDVIIKRDQGRFLIYNIPVSSMDTACERMTRVFGVHSISPALALEKNWDAIVSAMAGLVEAHVEGAERSFKVFSRRADKTFPMNSEAINREMGHELLERLPNMHVDVHKPQVKVCIEIREKAFLYIDEIMGAGGMPSGTAGRAALLISGGIDSPVAGYQLARRGVDLSAVHFYSYPYTSERARDKVITLTQLLARYSGIIRLHLVPFTEIQMAIYDRCPEKETTILMRRLMMRITEIIARKDGAQALITGEALGQVASQTLESLAVTDDAVQMPVFRPLIGFDKEDIVNIAKKIGTFETSILPYEDCCTVFVPQHPVTRPKVAQIRESEAGVNFTEMIKNALAGTEIMEIGSKK